VQKGVKKTDKTTYPWIRASNSLRDRSAR